MTPDLSDNEVLNDLFSAVAGEPAIALAVSGGADSLALMLLAHRWASGLQQPPKLHVYSVDHGLRVEAAQEVEQVIAEAMRLGIPSRGLRWTGDKPTSGVQEAARHARYALMGQAMAADGATVLLTAHHLNDQAETVLMRLAHGSGIEGLKGMLSMSEVAGIKVHRPLLGVDPAQLRAVVVAAGLHPAEDPSNIDPHYERVRWRQILPALSELGLTSDVLGNFAARIGEADMAIAQMADGCFAEIVQLDGLGSARVELTPFVGLSPAISNRLLGRVMKIVGGRQKPRALGIVERIVQSIRTGSLGKSATALGCVVRLQKDAIIVAREPGRMLPSDLVIAPHGQLVWDDRFLITNASDEAGLTAGVTDYLPRHRLEEFLGFKVTAPAEAIRTAPIVRNSAGQVLSLGGWSFDERVRVQLLVD